MSTDAVIGHDQLVHRLLTASARGSLGHAVLLLGPQGVGKTTVAQAVAEAALDAIEWPGGLERHPDYWIDDSGAENLGIERVKAGGKEPPTLQDFLRLRTYAGGRRVAVIARAERLTEPAANTLLKSIEEPPPNTLIILTTAHAERLPATVTSRCEAFVLAPVPTRTIATWLAESMRVTPEHAALCARLAAGRPGIARMLAMDDAAAAREVAAVDRFLSAGGTGVRGALESASALAPAGGAEGREQALRMLSTWGALTRDAACLAAGAPELVTWTSHRPALERWVDELTMARIVEILDRIAVAAESIAAYAQPRLTFDALFIDVFAGREGPPSTAGASSAPEIDARAGTRR